MGLGIGAIVAVAILVALPLAAVWLAGRWRDPPEERWALTPRPEQEALSEPGLAEFRIRREFGLRDEKRWSAVRRAVERGEAAPDGLGPAAHAWAESVLSRMDAGAGKQVSRRRARLTYAAAVAALVLGIAGSIVFLNRDIGIMYGIYALVVLVAQNPWRLRRQRTNAEAALTANSPVRGTDLR